MTPRIFISFATGDDDLVAQLSDSISRLENVEVYVPDWIQVEGKNMICKVKEGLDSSHVMIVLITFNSTNTVWLNQQIGYAFAKNIPIILIVEKEINIKGFLEQSDFIVYQRGNTKRNVYQVISKLRTMFPQHLPETVIKNFFITCPVCNTKFLEQLPPQDVLSQKVDNDIFLKYSCQFCSTILNIEPSNLTPTTQ